MTNTTVRNFATQPPDGARIVQPYRDHIVGFWSISGNLFVDASNNARHMAVKSVQTSSAKGQALFNSTSGGSWAETKTPIAVGAASVATPYMVSVWAKVTNSDSTYDVLFDSGNVATNQRCLLYVNAPSNPGRFVWSTTGSDPRCESVVIPGVWAQYAVLNNAMTTGESVSQEMYLNAARLGINLAGTASDLRIASATAYIAGVQDGSPTKGQYTLRGQIHSVVLAKGPVPVLRRIMRAHYENPYSLLSYRRIIPVGAAAATAPTLSDLRHINVGATSTQWSIDYAFS